MGCIYKVTNKVNGKIYVGQTRSSIEKRWGEHISAAKGDESKKKLGHFQRAIRKYGAEQFEVTCLETCPDTELDKREMFWIKELNSFEDGYNETIGGEGKTPYSDEQLLEYWSLGLTLTEIRKRFGVSKNTIGTRLRGAGITEEEINIRRYGATRKLNGTKVYKYDKRGRFVCEYSSIVEASKDVSKYRNLQAIKDAANDPHLTAFGYQWRYYKSDNIGHFNARSRETRSMVFQYNIAGRYIKAFSSIEDAAKAVGVTNEEIKDACNDPNKTSGGYQWRSRWVQSLARLYRSRKKVAQCDNEWNVICVYNHAHDASRKLKISNALITKACIGQIEYNGYKWRYVMEGDGL